MAAYQNGDETAFRILYGRHSPRVYGYLRKRIPDAKTVDDVFQAAFMKLHQARSHYDSSFPFLPWLFTICHSAMAQHFREYARGSRFLDSSGIQPDDLPAEAPVATALPVELEALPSMQRQALKLRYAEDLPFEEIARRLQTSETNARKVVSRGIQKLRLLISKNGSAT